MLEASPRSQGLERRALFNGGGVNPPSCSLSESEDASAYYLTSRSVTPVFLHVTYPVQRFVIYKRVVVYSSLCVCLAGGKVTC